MNEKSWDEMEEEERERASEYTSFPICPYCGYKHELDTYEDFPPGEDNTNFCHNCEKEFNWTSDVEVYYSTSKIESEQEA